MSKLLWAVAAILLLCVATSANTAQRRSADVLSRYKRLLANLEAEEDSLEQRERDSVQQQAVNLLRSSPRFSTVSGSGSKSASSESSALLKSISSAITSALSSSLVSKSGSGSSSGSGLALPSNIASVSGSFTDDGEPVGNEVSFGDSTTSMSLSSKPMSSSSSHSSHSAPPAPAPSAVLMPEPEASPHIVDLINGIRRSHNPFSIGGDGDSVESLRRRQSDILGPLDTWLQDIRRQTGTQNALTSSHAAVDPLLRKMKNAQDVAEKKLELYNEALLSKIEEVATWEAYKSLKSQLDGKDPTGKEADVAVEKARAQAAKVVDRLSSQFWNPESTTPDLDSLQSARELQLPTTDKSFSMAKSILSKLRNSPKSTEAVSAASELASVVKSAMSEASQHVRMQESANALFKDTHESAELSGRQISDTEANAISQAVIDALKLNKHTLEIDESINMSASDKAMFAEQKAQRDLDAAQSKIQQDIAALRAMLSQRHVALKMKDFTTERLTSQALSLRKHQLSSDIANAQLAASALRKAKSAFEHASGVHSRMTQKVVSEESSHESGEHAESSHHEGSAESSHHEDSAESAHQEESSVHEGSAESSNHESSHSEGGENGDGQTFPSRLDSMLDKLSPTPSEQASLSELSEAAQSAVAKAQEFSQSVESAGSSAGHESSAAASQSSQQFSSAEVAESSAMLYQYLKTENAAHGETSAKADQEAEFTAGFVAGLYHSLTDRRAAESSLAQPSESSQAEKLFSESVARKFVSIMSESGEGASAAASEGSHGASEAASEASEGSSEAAAAVSSALFSMVSESANSQGEDASALLSEAAEHAEHAESAAGSGGSESVLSFLSEHAENGAEHAENGAEHAESGAKSFSAEGSEQSVSGATGSESLASAISRLLTESSEESSAKQNGAFIEMRDMLMRWRRPRTATQDSLQPAMIETDSKPAEGSFISRLMKFLDANPQPPRAHYPPTPGVAAKLLKELKDAGPAPPAPRAPPGEAALLLKDLEASLKQPAPARIQPFSLVAELTRRVKSAPPPLKVKVQSFVKLLRDRLEAAEQKHAPAKSESAESSESAAAAAPVALTPTAQSFHSTLKDLISLWSGYSTKKTESAHEASHESGSESSK